MEGSMKLIPKSAFGGKADIARTCSHVRYWHKADMTGDRFSQDRRCRGKGLDRNVEALPLKRRSSNVHLLRAATRPSIGGRAGLGIAQGPTEVRPMPQVVGEVAKEVLILAWAINDGFSGGRGTRAPAVTGSSSRGTSRAKLPG